MLKIDFPEINAPKIAEKSNLLELSGGEGSKLFQTMINGILSASFADHNFAKKVKKKVWWKIRWGI